MEYSKEYIYEFSEFLDRINYHVLLTMILGEEIYFKDPLPAYALVKREIKKVDPEQQYILSFLLLGEPVNKKHMDSQLSSECLEYLYSSGIINRDEEDYWLNSLVLTSHMNCYFLVSTPFFYPTCQNKVPSPYIGRDTFWLTRAIVNRVHGRVLDLCTGSGIQAIISAKVSAEVYAVDIDERALEIAKFNGFLNKVDHKITFYHGNLYEPVKDKEKFDFILSNPPFIPIPDGVDYPKSGDGGEDGLRVVREIYNGYLHYLKENGTGLMIGQAIGTEDRVFMFEEMKLLFSQRNLDLYIFESLPLSIQADNFSNLSNRLQMNEYPVSALQWAAVNERLGASMYHSFFSVVSSVTVSSTHNLHIMDNRWTKSDIPILDSYEITETSKRYSVKSAQGKQAVMDEETRIFIQEIDGESTVDEIIKKLPLKIKLKYGKNASDYLYAKYMLTLAKLERVGLLKKATPVEINP